MKKKELYISFLKLLLKQRSRRTFFKNPQKLPSIGSVNIKINCVLKMDGSGGNRYELLCMDDDASDPLENLVRKKKQKQKNAGGQQSTTTGNSGNKTRKKKIQIEMKMKNS